MLIRGNEANTKEKAKKRKPFGEEKFSHGEAAAAVQHQPQQRLPVMTPIHSKKWCVIYLAKKQVC